MADGGELAVMRLKRESAERNETGEEFRGVLGKLLGILKFGNSIKIKQHRCSRL
ncbi:hypothetical protein CCACVL1_21353 [Corchorus capsularis]|uniref:Uncharacterized protein n=1 Tax=Corchorus capsularis TaxID=210143 RepID=A0A1R3H6M4_COCAP|nr:hypothetical protein CCACVL1_21353 [Corchorus capsularis]